MTESHSLPTFLDELVDDAAAVTSGGASLAPAVLDHAAHRTSAHVDLLGAFAVADSDLPGLADQVAASSLTDPLPVAVVVGGGAGALAPAVSWATRSDRLRLTAVHVAVRESDADLAPNARRIVAAADALATAGDLDEDVAVYVEPPRLSGADPSSSWLRALDEVAAVDHRLTLRAGGPDPDAFPSSAELAAFIGAALDRELAFCAAGLHRVVRHSGRDGRQEHGILNLLLATRASLDGAGPPDVVAVLDERDGATLTARLDPVATTSARRWFTSALCESVEDAVRELTALGLLEGP